MPTPADMTAIVVAFDSAAVLPACLDAIAREGMAAIVVDNASLDGSAGIAERAGARVIRNARNEGYGRANNAGIAAARTSHVLVCNPDLTLAPGAAALLAEAAGRFPEAGLWAPLVIEPDGRRFVQPRSLLAPAHLNAARGIVIPDGPASLPFLSGACFLIERALFLEIGGFDPAIFLFYEDDDLCRRLMDLRRRPLLVPGATAVHLRGASSATRPGRRFRARWHMAWSERHVRAKHGLPAAPLWPVLANALKALANLAALRRQGFERYGGFAAGAAAFMLGRSALAREGLSR